MNEKYLLDNEEINKRLQRITEIKNNNLNIVRKDVNITEPIYTKNIILYGAPGVGKNLGYETFGKGDEFLRPVLVFKKFSRNTFLGIPLTTSTKNDIFHYEFIIKNNSKVNYASLSQLRIFDVSRMHDKLDKMSVDNFSELKVKLGVLLGLIDTPLEKGASC